MGNNEKIGIIAFILALICLSAVYNLSTTTTATGGITYYYVSSGTLVNGTLISGGIAALNESNGSVLIIRESTGQPGYNIQFSFKNVQRFTALSEISYYLGATTHYRFIEIYDFYSNAWTMYNSDYGQPNYTSNYIYVSNYTKHIAANGSVFVRYYHPVSGSIVHYLILDQLLLVDSYSVAALTENNISNTYNNYTTINNYTNITQGAGGVSFNGASVDLNGSLLINGTFSNLNDTKVNKSGDTMTGDLNFNFIKNITNSSYVFSKHIMGINLDGQLITDAAEINNIWPDDAKSYVGGSDYVLQLTAINNSASGTFTSWSSDNVDEGSVFSAIRGRGTPAKPDNLTSNDRLFWIGGRGIYYIPGVGWTVSASKANIVMKIAEPWTSTAQGTKMTFGVTKKGTTTRQDVLVLNNSNVTLPLITGTGNSYLCINKATSEIYAGNPTC